MIDEPKARQLAQEKIRPSPVRFAFCAHLKLTSRQRASGGELRLDELASPTASSVRRAVAVSNASGRWRRSADGRPPLVVIERTPARTLASREHGVSAVS